MINYKIFDSGKELCEFVNREKVKFLAVLPMKQQFQLFYAGKNEEPKVQVLEVIK